jgi:hypothetical protein
MRRLLSTAVLFGLGIVGAAVQERVHPPPAQAEEPEPESERVAREERLHSPQDVEENTAKASVRYEATREGAEVAYRRLVEDFEGARNRGDLDSRLRETARVRSLHAFLVELRKLGEKVLADEATFKAAFDEFQGAGATALTHYRDSAERSRSRPKRR